MNDNKLLDFNGKRHVAFYINICPLSSESLCFASVSHPPSTMASSSWFSSLRSHSKSLLSSLKLSLRSSRHNRSHSFITKPLTSPATSSFHSRRSDRSFFFYLVSRSSYLLPFALAVSSGSLALCEEAETEHRSVSLCCFRLRSLETAPKKGFFSSERFDVLLEDFSIECYSILSFMAGSCLIASVKNGFGKLFELRKIRFLIEIFFIFKAN